jgi:hypothetical protein
MKNESMFFDSLNLPRLHFSPSSWLQPQSTSKSSNNKTNEGRINRCRICGKVYARPSTLKTHLRTHSGEKVKSSFFFLH